MIKTEKYKHWFSLKEKHAGYGNNFVSKVADNVDLRAEGNNEVVAVISSDSIDRSGEIVLPKGVDLTDFRKQPAVYFEHDTDALPLGPCLNIKATDKQIIARYRIVTEATELHKAIWELVKAGAYRSHSIGFLSFDNDPPSAQELRFHPEWKGAKAIHRKSSLLEFSLVGMPCNTDAVALAVSKGFSAKTIDVLKGGKAEDKSKEGIEKAIVETVVTEIAAPNRKALGEAIYEAAKAMNVNVDVSKAIQAAMNRLTQ